MPEEYIGDWELIKEDWQAIDAWLANKRKRQEDSKVTELFLHVAEGDKLVSEPLTSGEISQEHPANIEKIAKVLLKKGIVHPQYHEEVLKKSTLLKETDRAKLDAKILELQVKEQELAKLFSDYDSGTQDIQERESRYTKIVKFGSRLTLAEKMALKPSLEHMLTKLEQKKHNDPFVQLELQYVKFGLLLKDGKSDYAAFVQFLKKMPAEETGAVRNFLSANFSDEALLILAELCHDDFSALEKLVSFLDPGKRETLFGPLGNAIYLITQNKIEDAVIAIDTWLHDVSSITKKDFALVEQCVGGILSHLRAKVERTHMAEEQLAPIHHLVAMTAKIKLRANNLEQHIALKPHFQGKKETHKMPSDHTERLATELTQLLEQGTSQVDHFLLTQSLENLREVVPLVLHRPLPNDRKRVLIRQLREYYPHIDEYLHYEDPEEDPLFGNRNTGKLIFRTVRPKGMEVAVRHLHDQGVLSAPCSVLDDMDKAETQLLERAFEIRPPAIHTFIVGNFQTTEQTAHWTPVMFYPSEDGTEYRMVVTDSAGQRAKGIVFDRLRAISQTIASRTGKPCKFLFFNETRQRDHFNCSVFSLQDVIRFCKSTKLIKAYFENILAVHKNDEYAARYGINVQVLPHYGFMKSTQSISQIQKEIAASTKVASRARAEKLEERLKRQSAKDFVEVEVQNEVTGQTLLKKQNLFTARQAEKYDAIIWGHIFADVKPLEEIVGLAKKFSDVNVDYNAASKLDAQLWEQRVAIERQIVAAGPKFPPIDLKAFRNALETDFSSDEECEAFCRKHGIDIWTFPEDYKSLKEQLLSAAAQCKKEPISETKLWRLRATLTGPIKDFSSYLLDCREGKKREDKEICAWLNTLSSGGGDKWLAPVRGIHDSVRRKTELWHSREALEKEVMETARPFFFRGDRALREKFIGAFLENKLASVLPMLTDTVAASQIKEAIQKAIKEGCPNMLQYLLQLTREDRLAVPRQELEASLREAPDEWKSQLLEILKKAGCLN
jgi:hypothetical protein